MIAHNFYIWKALHAFHEIIGGTIDLAIGKHHYILLPSQVGRWFHVLWFHLGEVIMPLACFVLIVSYEGFLVTESRCEFLGIGKISATVTAYIDDEAITENEILDDFVEIAFSMAVLKL